MSVIQINAQDAFELLKKDQNSILIDVRTFEEFNFVGIVNGVSFNNRMTLLPWQILPSMNENPDFAISLEKSTPFPTSLYSCQSCQEFALVGLLV